MKNVSRFVAVLLSVALLAAAPAAPASEAVRDGVLRATLDNGLQVVIVRNPLAPVVSEITTYKAGFDQAPADYPETPHAVEHMVAGRSLADLSENQAANIWTLLGANANAETTNTTTRYFFTVPSEFLNVTLHVEAERMRGALFDANEWNDERPAIVNELQTAFSDATGRTIRKALAALYPGRFDDSTRLPGLAKTTPAVLRDFYERWYAPNNAVLVITGDVEPVATLASVKSIFGSIPSRPVGEKKPFVPGPLKAQTISDSSDLPVPLAFYAWRMPGQASPEYPVAQIASDVLSSQRGAITALGFEGKALFAAFEYAPIGTDGVALGLIASAPGADPKAALPLLASTIDGVRTAGAPADLVEAAKRREIAGALYRRNSIEGLASEWANALTDAAADSPQALVDRFHSVTVDDVNRFLRSSFNSRDAITGVLTPKPGSAGGGGNAGSIKDSFAPKDAKPVTLPAWAAVLETPARPPAPRPLPADMTLANGIRLIVERNTISPTVTLIGRVRENADLQAPPGKDGVDGIVAGLFPYGTMTLDRLAFQKALDDVAVDVSAGSSFSAEAPKEEFGRAVDLLADNLLHPAFPARAFTIVQAQSAQSLQGSLTTPDYLASRAMDLALLPKGDPSLREATPKTVASLTLADAKAYFDTAYRPDETTIVVVGDITPDDARAAIEHSFSAWKAPGPQPNLDLPPVPPNRAAAKKITASGRTQASVALSQTLALNRRSPDYYPLRLGNSVLGGGFYSSRFYKDLRKNTGLVYSVSAGVDAGRTRATYDVDYKSSPKNVGRARAIVDRDLKEMSVNPVGDEELQLAKNQVIRSIPLTFASIDGIAGAYLNYAGQGLALNEADHAMSIYAGLTPASVQSAFKRHIDPARFVQVTTGPAAP